MKAALLTGIVVAATALSAAVFWIRIQGLRRTPDSLRPGSPLPEFTAADEQGRTLRSAELQGSPAILLFVRGNWCPFCTAQVRELTDHYKEIVNLGARLILLTPRPLETTRRVAKFFEVDFEFWLDDGLAVTKQLGLLQKSGVPKSYDTEYGRDTIWPTAIVVDPAGIIRYTELSKHISDRPDPEVLIRELKKALKT
jgi:peroxiredoxin